MSSRISLRPQIRLSHSIIVVQLLSHRHYHFQTLEHPLPPTNYIYFYYCFVNFHESCDVLTWSCLTELLLVVVELHPTFFLSFFSDCGRQQVFLFSKFPFFFYMNRNKWLWKFVIIMRTLCDVCESAAAILFCAADEAALCRVCDEKVPVSLLDSSRFCFQILVWKKQMRIPSLAQMDVWFLFFFFFPGKCEVVSMILEIVVAWNFSIWYLVFGYQEIQFYVNLGV